jgi:hypothetical protein
MLQWTASPLCQFDCFSPDGSNLSFTMTSPPCPFPHGTAEVVLASLFPTEHLNSSFSPSIFSPPEKIGSRHPKKRDIYRDPTLVERNGIAGMAASAVLSPVSRPESRNSVDLQALAL